MFKPKRKFKLFLVPSVFNSFTFRHVFENEMICVSSYENFPGFIKNSNPPKKDYVFLLFSNDSFTCIYRFTRPCCCFFLPRKAININVTKLRFHSRRDIHFHLFDVSMSLLYFKEIKWKLVFRQIIYHQCKLYLPCRPN